MNNAEIFNETEKVFLASCGKDSCPNCPEGGRRLAYRRSCGKGIEKLREVRDIIKDKVKTEG